MKQNSFHLPNLVGFLFFSSYFLYRLVLQIYFVRRSTPLSFGIWINWLLIMAIFLFFAVVYAVRGKPLLKACGWRERALPFFCAIIPALLYEIPKLARFSLIQQHGPLFSLIQPLHINSFGPWPANSLLIIGHAIALLGFLQLGKAFSIMTEARNVVNTGIYRFIRHPVYLGESIAILGIGLSVPTRLGIFLALFWLFAQRYRAFVEEKKLSSAFPSYTVYKETTGAYLPKLS